MPASITFFSVALSFGPACDMSFRDRSYVVVVVQDKRGLFNGGTTGTKMGGAGTGVGSRWTDTSARIGFLGVHFSAIGRLVAPMRHVLAQQQAGGISSLGVLPAAPPASSSSSSSPCDAARGRGRRHRLCLRGRGGGLSLLLVLRAVLLALALRPVPTTP